MGELSNCFIWGDIAMLDRVEGEEAYTITASRAGGRYRQAFDAARAFENRSDVDKAKLTTWLVDQRRMGDPAPLITAKLCSAVTSWPRLTATQRRDRAVEALASINGTLGGRIQLNDRLEEGGSTLDTLTAWTESTSNNETGAVLQFACDDELIKMTHTNTYQVTFKGWQLLDNLRTKGAAADQAFVAMWFSSETDKLYSEGIERAIIDSGYRPMRIDRKEHVNRIDDEIIAEIRRSRFLIADFTSEPDKPRGGVYFEAGFAYGLNIPVIWTCKETMIGFVHLDTRQFNHILWKDPEELRAKLVARIGAVIGDGPLKSRV